jgi:hypothetical protein
LGRDRDRPAVNKSITVSLTPLIVKDAPASLLKFPAVISTVSRSPVRLGEPPLMFIEVGRSDGLIGGKSGRNLWNLGRTEYDKGLDYTERDVTGVED